MKHAIREEMKDYAYRLAKDFNIQLQITMSSFDEETLSDVQDDLDYAFENGSFEYKEPVAWDYESELQMKDFAYDLATKYAIKLQIVTSNFDEETLSKMQKELDNMHVWGSEAKREIKKALKMLEEA